MANNEGGGSTTNAFLNPNNNAPNSGNTFTNFANQASFGNNNNAPNLFLQNTMSFGNNNNQQTSSGFSSFGKKKDEENYDFFK